MKDNITIIVGDTPENITGEYHVLTGEAYGDFSQNTDIKPFIHAFRDYLANKGFNQELVNICIGFSGMADSIKSIQNQIEELKRTLVI